MLLLLDLFSCLFKVSLVCWYLLCATDDGFIEMSFESEKENLSLLYTTLALPDYISVVSFTAALKC